ncbi:hypothetical protein BD311DRAFT_567591 [Dichomitus squalens]|uniref:Uncharacterized protein n=1 Tax=Dichomitus squalens TaxID=114155 RepID=A0A4Q9MAN4_9APHY|nr:hypothetical protein BD311DRAFT_567591 [Dichomitus squalens]
MWHCPKHLSSGWKPFRFEREGGCTRPRDFSSRGKRPGFEYVRHFTCLIGTAEAFARGSRLRACRSATSIVHSRFTSIPVSYAMLCRTDLHSCFMGERLVL